MSRIGVVIVSFNTRALLRDCLGSLRGCACPLRVVVVDNASADGSAAMVRECFPAAELLALGQNLGFAAGTNAGIRHLGIGEKAARAGDGVAADGQGLDHGKLIESERR